MSDATNPPVDSALLSDANRIDQPTVAENKTIPKRGTTQSGFSVLARGEPQVWFTGGMLIVCLAMVSGLLVLILSSGLPTFWPQHVDLIVLNNGQFEIGQIQETVPVEADGVAERAASHSSSATASSEDVRRSYRTGNWEFTGKHYRWLEPSEVSSQQIVRPPQALDVERIELGRLYGMPLQLFEKIEVEDVVEAEATAVALLKSLFAQLPAESFGEELSALISRIEESHAQRLDSAVRASLKKVNSGTTQVLLTEGQWKSWMGTPETVKLQGARHAWNYDDPALMPTLQQALSRTNALRDEAEGVKIEISRVDERIFRLRAGVRRVEIDVDESLPVPVDSCQVVLDNMLDWESKLKQLPQLRELVQTVFDSNDQSRSAALAALDQLENEFIPQALSELNKKNEEWLAKFAKLPEQLRAAVAAYQIEFKRLQLSKRPLESELAKLEHELDSFALSVVVPSAATLFSFPAQLSVTTAAGSVQGIVLDGINGVMPDQKFVSGSTVPLTGTAHLVYLVDQAGMTHCHAIVQPSQAEVPQLVQFPQKTFELKEFVRVTPSNELTLMGKFGVYLDRWREFLFSYPREANTEGGVFPAIWGMIVMTLIMTVISVPFGVMAALYLREYTKSGPLVSLIRISINNLAGVPSIVYGVFGLSFFCYTVGAYIDGGPKNAGISVWPPNSWYLMLGLTAVVGTVAFFCSFASSGPGHSQTPLKRLLGKAALFCWIGSLILVAFLLFKSPFFNGFYREYLPNPTFGKGGLVWASMTLALLTLPVVIVATEEALAAVPNSLREGSLACGASKWQTIRRIVLPHARPGILTGAILAMARGTGEVAPLMLVGALPTAPDLPLDSEFPYLHPSRSFMHLAYQIYNLGFQSPNSEAARPMVFTCTLLLIFIVGALNISAIYLRAKLRKKFQGSQF